MESKMEIESDKIYNMDCLEGMRRIPTASIDAIICDLPYGTTACAWDSVIPFDQLWEQYKRIIKPHGAIVLTAREPFTSMLVMSNIENYKHKWVWNKKQSGSFFNAKLMPLQIEEDVLVFCFGGKVNYYPIMRKGEYRLKGQQSKETQWVKGLNVSEGCYNDDYYPTNILEYPNCQNKGENIHPTQKPVDLLRYLIRTYSNEGDTILDNCMGSGTTAVACIKEKRHFIGFELNKDYYDKACKRIDAERRQLSLF